MSGWHPSTGRAQQATRAWLQALTEASRQESYRESRQSEGQIKAEILTEDKGFQETYFLALGVGLALVFILLLVIVVSTPQIASRARSFFCSNFATISEDTEVEDMESQKKCKKIGKRPNQD